MTDPFLYYDISFSKVVRASGELVFPKQAPFSSLNLSPGRQLLMLQLTNMMGITPEEFQFMPIGSLFLSLTMFLLAYELLGSALLSMLVTLYLALNLSHAAALYSTFAYALGYPIMLGFLVLCARFLREKNYLAYPLLLIMFTSLNFIHYTLTVWTILFLLGANITIELQRYLNQKKIGRLRPAFYLSLAFFVFFLTFNETLYQSYIPKLAPDILESAIQRFFSFFIYSPADVFKSPFVFSRASEVNFVSTITLAIILLPVLVGFSFDIWNLLVLKSKAYLSDDRVPFIWAFIFLGIADSIAYSIRGSISTKSFSMLFPLVSLAYLMRTRKPWIVRSMAILLLGTSIIKIPLFYREAYFIRGNGTDFEGLELSSNWIVRNLEQERYTMLADMNLYGKYLTVSVGTGHTPIFRAFDDNEYAMVVIGLNLRPELEMPDLVAIDKNSTQPTIGFYWNIYAPLGNYLALARKNGKLNIVYEDDNVVLARLMNVDQAK
jgi:hypothetical protein